MGVNYSSTPRTLFGDLTKNASISGKWWMFTRLKTSNTGDCPIGYQFHGGASARLNI
jgi:hypothetical protein